MSLFVANRKAEKFRHMITGSLYDIIADKRSSLIPTHAQDSSGFHHALHWCEIFPDTAGYGLAMKDEKEYRQNGSAKMKGTVLDSDHQQGNLLKGKLFDMVFSGRNRQLSILTISFSSNRKKIDNRKDQA